jgi:D-glycero-alpha-D-manno-heptose-7-phosphate kinase
VARNAHHEPCVAGWTPAGPPEVIAVAPLRVDLTGGFTDIPPFSASIDSLHINAAFNHTVTVRCRMREDGGVHVSFSPDGNSASAGVPEGRPRFVRAVRAAVTEFADERGMDLQMRSAATPGSGLGSSGALLVAAIDACAKLTGTVVEASAAAQKAIRAATMAGIVGGCQDEFAAAHGSLRTYLFARGGTPRIVDLASNAVCQHLEESLLVVQMSVDGRKSDIVAEVVHAVRSGHRGTLGTLHRLQELAHQLFDALSGANVEAFPELMGQIRVAQCALHPEICCPATAQVLASVRQEIPQLEYKFLGGGGIGSCTLVYIPTNRMPLALSLLGHFARKVLSIKIRHSGVTTESVNAQQRDGW